MGTLIVIEGLDGTGKTTQVERVSEILNSRGIKARKINFPAYGKDSCKLVEMYLRGDFGANPSDINAYAASTFYAVDRFAQYSTDWKQDYDSGTVILSDRYISANVIYQSAKLKTLSERKKFYEWCYEFEVGQMGIPRESATIALYAEPEALNNLLLKRYSGQEDKKDIHEGNLAYLHSCHDTLLEASDILGWDTAYIGDNNGGILRIDEITQILLAKIHSIID